MEEIQMLLRAQSSNLSLSERSEAFGEIVRRFQDMAFGCAYAVLGDFHLAEDAAQEAFLEAWRNLDYLREPLAFASWFRRIVLTQCNRLTRGKTVVTIPLDDAVAFASHAPDPHALAEQRELRDHVLAAIKAPPEHERIVTTLFYINGYSQNEIADFLDLKVATVKTRLHSATGRLKKGMIEMVQDDLQQKRPYSKYSYLGDLGEYYQRFIESTIQVTIQMEALCDYLTSQHEINWDTATAANLLAKLDWPTLENLPSRIDALSLDEWFTQVWVVCGSVLGSKYDPAPIFENAIAQCSRWIAKSIGDGLDLTIQVEQHTDEAEVTDKIYQLQLLYKLRNTGAQKNVQDEPLFQAADALIQYGHDLKGIIIAMLNCDDANPAYYGAARLATRFWSEEIIDRLMVGLDAGYPKSRSASSTFVAIGSPAIPALIGESKDDTRYIHGGNIDRHIRVAVATVLGQIGDSAAVPALIQALRGRHTAARRRVAWALGEIGDAAALPALVEALKDDEDPKVRQQVVVALGKMGGPAAVDALRQALNDENQYVRFHAERALKEIGTPEAMEAVETQ